LLQTVPGWQRLAHAPGPNGAVREPGTPARLFPRGADARGHEIEQLPHLKGLLDGPGHAEPRRVPMDPVYRTHERDGQHQTALPHRGTERPTVQPWHQEVEQYQIRRTALDELERLLAIGCANGRIAGVGQELGNHLADEIIVVNHDHVRPRFRWPWAHELEHVRPSVWHGSRVPRTADRVDGQSVQPTTAGRAESPLRLAWDLRGRLAHSRLRPGGSGGLPTASSP